MKWLKWIICLCLFVNCKDRKPESDLRQIFSENEYYLLSKKDAPNGTKSFELFRHKKDTTKFLTKTYWENGALQALLYYNKTIKSGPARMYDENGIINFEGFYLNGVENGLFLYYNKGQVSDFQIYNNGKQIISDTSLKKNIGINP